MSPEEPITVTLRFEPAPPKRIPRKQKKRLKKIVAFVRRGFQQTIARAIEGAGFRPVTLKELEEIRANAVKALTEER